MSETRSVPASPQELFTALEAAAYLRVSRRTLDRLPVPRAYVGRLPRWLKADLDAYLADHRIEMTRGEPARLVAPPPMKPCRKPALGLEEWRRRTLARIKRR